MTRGKVQMRRIENPVRRQVTFCKRRAGLLKKARELSVLCQADIGIIIFSTHGKLYELATNGSMECLIERYKNACGEAQSGGDLNQTQEAVQQAMMLKQEFNLLQKGLRYAFGDGSTDQMTLEELLAVEKHLEVWMYNTRSAKTQLMLQEIQALKNKEGMLKATNELLHERIILEQIGPSDVAQMLAHKNGVSDGILPMTLDMSCPGTVQNDNLYYRGSEMS